MTNSLYRKMFFTRLGIIFSNAAIVSAIIAAGAIFASIVYGLFVVFAFLVVLMLVLVTVFLILAIYPHIFDIVQSEFATEVIVFLLNYVAPPAAFISLVASVLSVVFLFFGEPKKHVARIVISCIFIAISLIFVVFVVAGVKK